MVDQTQSDILESSGRAAGPAPTLYLALRANAPGEPPSRHDLAGVETVTFGRGERSATRAGDVLALRVPDPLMSSEHGTAAPVAGRWMLDDASSKNGILLATGQRVRSVPLTSGTTFALGGTVFVFDRSQRASQGARDVLADDLIAPLPELVTFDDAFRAAVDVLARVATADVPVMLFGETGTGKEVLARALHVLSRRRGAFVAVNCGSIATNLVEAELFGHKKGSFSGATSDRQGHLRAADNGTLFLDEIAELPPMAQTALLRALQQREVVPVGESLPIAVDFRSCVATHRDLASMVAAGTYREDLYARLMGVTIRIPPLRQRRCDLGILIRSLLARRSHAHAKLSPAAALALLCYRWPLNIRELERALVAGVALADDGTIGLEHLPDALQRGGGPVEPIEAPVSDAVLSTADLELKQRLLQLLDENEHNLAEVARRLGKDRTQIYRWVRRFGIARVGRD